MLERVPCRICGASVCRNARGQILRHTRPAGYKWGSAGGYVTVHEICPGSTPRSKP